MIYAIASTNAIVAGIQVSESMKIWTRQQDKLQMVHVNNILAAKIAQVQKKPGNLDCPTCSLRNCLLQFKANFEHATLNDVKRLLETQYGVSPTATYETCS